MRDGQRYAIDVKPDMAQPETAAVVAMFVGDRTCPSINGVVRWKTFVPALLGTGAALVNCPTFPMMEDQLAAGTQVSFSMAALQSDGAKLRSLIGQHLA
jgi:hypothetical protein